MKIYCPSKVSITNKKGYTGHLPCSLSSLYRAVLLIDLAPRVLQSDGAVEHHLLRRGVLVYVEVADALELEVRQRLHALGKLLDVAVRQDVEGIRVDDFLHRRQCVAVLLLADGSQGIARILYFPEAVVEAYFGFEAMGAAHPVERALHLAVGTGHATLAVGVVFGVDFHHAACLVLLAARALHDVGILEAHFLAGSHAEVLLGSHLHEVITLHP